MADEILSQDEIEALIAQASQNEAQQPVAASEVKPDVYAQAEQDIPQAVPFISVSTAASVPQMSQPVVPPAAQHVEQNVRKAEFNPLGISVESSARSSMDLIMDVQLQVAVELGRAKMLVRDVLSIGPGSVVELDKHAGEPVEVVVNNKVVARGEVVVIDENFGVRITEIVNASDREVMAKAA